jgi:PAS domain S-box-containing protein
MPLKIDGIARRLNFMAEQIRRVTASRDKLDREITERKQIEAGLRQKTTDLEAAHEKLTASDKKLIASYEELTRNQQALAESERKYHNLYHYAQVGLFETSVKDGTVVACNRQFANLAGFHSVEEAIGKDITGLYANPDDRREVGRILREQGFIENYTVRFRNQTTGKLFWGQFSARFNYGREAAEGTIIDVTARKDAEETLQQSEARLSLALDVSNAGVWEWNLESNEVYLDDRFHALLGYSPGELPSTLKDWLSYHHPDDVPDWMVKAEAYLRGESPVYEREHRIRTKAGTWAWVFTRGQLVNIPATESRKLFVGIAMNVTERKHAAIEYASIQQQYRELFESVQIGILMTTPEPQGTIIEANPAAVRIYEADSREQLLAVHTSDLYYDTDQQRKISEEIIAKGSIKGMEIRYKTLKGRTFWGRITAIKKISDDNEVYIYNTIENITSLRQAQDTLRETAENLNKLINFTNALIIVWDPAFRITRFNPAFERLTGKTEQEVIGQRLDILFPEESRADSFTLIQETIKTGGFENIRIPILGSDGTLRTVLWNSAAILTTETELVSTIAQGVDITEIERSEMLREALIRELEQKNTELERFTFTVSHDLKSPLITIKGFASLLEDDALTGDPLLLKRDVQRITAAADTMQALLTDLLELSRKGRIVKPPETIPFGMIAHEAVDLLTGPLGERGITVEVESDLPVVKVDHVRIREVMVNLIENAIKFSGDRPDPVIRIGVKRSGATPSFFVQDNGIGIDPRYLKRIFNLFERLDVSTPGTGIGLTIARRIIEAHGGKIWAESEGPGKGMTMCFTLPAVRGGGTDNHING